MILKTSCTQFILHVFFSFGTIRFTQVFEGYFNETESLM